MKLYYDLHIHSCLSPCGDVDMTPNNIVNMAKIKGLDVIAITDHNCIENVPAALAVAAGTGILLVPGMEVQTREEVHVLCYFENLDAIKEFAAQLEPYRICVPNRPDYFGRQMILDDMDRHIGDYPHLLIQSFDVSIEKLKQMVVTAQGVFVPAHINKAANSLLGQLGFIPESLSIKTVEIYARAPADVDLEESYRIVHNSDAHYLTDIHEAHYAMELEAKCLKDVLEWLKGN